MWYMPILGYYIQLEGLFRPDKRRKTLPEITSLLLDSVAISPVDLVNYATESRNLVYEATRQFNHS